MANPFMPNALSEAYFLCRPPLPAPPSLLGEVLAGLQQPQKTLPCKLFYDAYGSQLFDQICELEEYYPTRTEIAIMRRHIGAMAACIGDGALLVEYGSGSSLKTHVLLEHLPNLAGYVPIDISREHLMRSAALLARAYPGLPIYPLCADYTGAFALPPTGPAARTMAYFPGSTIGNFEPQAARAFLRRVAELCGPHGGLLIGVDLKKDAARLEAAYNDRKGVTAAFNLNILRHVNRAFQGTFRLDRFAHRAHYNATCGRIEMHLVSLAAQRASVAGHGFAFGCGETIHTENSYKYGVEGFARLAGGAGWAAARVWTDDAQLFSVQYLTPASAS